MLSTDLFELSLLASLLKDELFLRKVVGLVNETFFSSALSSDVYSLIKSYFSEYQRIPEQNELLHLYRSQIASDSDVAEKFVSMLYTQSVNIDFISSELHRYVRLRELENLFRSNYEKIKQGNEVDTSNIVNDIFKIQLASLSEEHRYGINIDEAEYFLKQEENRKFVPTNVHYLNEVLDGGLRDGQLGIVLAPPNYGKTMLLLNFAVYAYLKGNNVLFVTLEMPEFSIFRRITMLMAGALRMKVDSATITQIANKLQKKFIILYRPVKSMNVEFLYSVYHQAQADGVNFDCIFIDYADLLASSSKYKEKRFEYGDIFYSLKAFAQIINKAVWSATQSNREGMKSDLVTMEHLSESLEKGFVSDVIFSLSDKMQANSVVKGFLTKNREGRSNINCDMYINQNMWVEEKEETEIDVGAVDLGEK